MKVNTFNENGNQTTKERDMETSVVLTALSLSLTDDDVMSVTVVFNDGTYFMAVP